jgi:hypothetical protein
MEEAELNHLQRNAVDFVNALFSDEIPSIARLQSTYDEVYSANEVAKQQRDKQASSAFRMAT